ncbi:hypothetical protein VNO78_08198 [Psophocarpus tetragonolobus]|uniref:Uncharacterized protein n=1 Tax=Psophocarpus tetragonolobus TaxID=3891 RepID=A0AAN9SUP5_PSOTE
MLKFNRVLPPIVPLPCSDKITKNRNGIFSAFCSCHCNVFCTTTSNQYFQPTLLSLHTHVPPLLPPNPRADENSNDKLRNAKRSSYATDPCQELVLRSRDNSNSNRGDGKREQTGELEQRKKRVKIGINDNMLGWETKGIDADYEGIQAKGGEVEDWDCEVVVV